MTACEICQRAEATRWQRLAGRALDLIDRPSPAMQMIASAAHTYSVLLGGRAEPSWYEKHREAYTRTGDPAELTRMLRHVSP